MLESRLKEEDHLLINSKVFLHEHDSRGRSYVAHGGWCLGDRHQDKGQVKICRRGASPILVYGGATCESSPSEAQSRKVVRLEEMKIAFIDLKWIKRKAKV